MERNKQNEFITFVKNNFKPVKIKGGKPHFIGRRTADFLTKERGGARLSHLSPALLADIVAEFDLRSFEFDDGNVYVVCPLSEKEIMVEFYELRNLEEGDDGTLILKDNAPVLDSDLLENFRISEAAIFEITGETPEDLQLSSDSIVDFISTEQIEECMDAGTVKVFFEEGVYTVISTQEDTPELENYDLYLETMLPGCEISLDELDLTQRTIITGTYRDQVGKPKNDI